MTSGAASPEERSVAPAARAPAASDDAVGGTGATGGSALVTDPAMRAWLDRCRELAKSEPEGIEDPARELALLAGGDRVLMEQARRVLCEALEREPRNPLLRQMYAFWRRAFEKGSWSWEESALDHSPYLSE